MVFLKRILTLVMTGSLLLSIYAFAAEKTYLISGEAKAGASFAIREDIGVYGIEETHFCIENINLTGINSVKISALCEKAGGNGDLILVRLDSASGKVIGRIDLGVGEEFTEYSGAIEKTEGVHDIYFMSLFSTNSTKVKSVTFSDEEYTYKYEPVPDDKVIDKHESTWTLTDSLGRKMADYEEVGEIKEGKEVGIFYWTWHKLSGESSPVNNTEFMKQHPDAKYDYNHPAWPTGGVVHYWNEPLFGYYTAEDYWVMRKHAVMLADAGVDAMYFDCTNGKATFRASYEVLFKALRDAKNDGNKVPKIGFVSNFAANNPDAKYNIMATYFGAYHGGKYSDLWYMVDGKPLIIAHPDQLKSDDEEISLIMDEIKNFFTFRFPEPDHTQKFASAKHWGWLRTYGNTLAGAKEDGSFEMASVGVAVNRSYETGKIDAMNTPYVMGRGYMETLGDDHSSDAHKYGYLFREQLSAALSNDVDMMFITGWNEWTVVRHIEWNTTKNAFPDQYDDRASRDIEPTKGELKDIYYCLLVDAVRRFKGAEKLQDASGEISIDINNLSSWSGVLPEYFGDRGTYERNAEGMGKVTYKNSTMRNNPVYMKVARDASNLYFMAETENALTGTGEENFMNLYINADRNYHTGWEGYDYVLANGKISKLSPSGGKTEAGAYEFNISDKAVALKADRNILGLNGVLDFEFKWTDNVGTGDILDFYVNGNVAPMGRFNYRYTEKKISAPTDAERSALNGITLVKPGSTKMLVNGGKSDLAENNPLAYCTEINGEAYIPFKALEKILGFGITKVKYDSFYNILFVYTSDSDGIEIGEYKWAGAVLNTNEVRVNGVLKALKNPVIAYENTVYVPLSFLNDTFGIETAKTEGGLYVIGEEASGMDRYSVYFD